ncbi:MAG: polyphosphate polymerase domain-containing protein [Candidatus Marinimicrobia bacterium]|jgi:hypothetical protein|nr:polyphosphate polymerase domain-containing protein [Candidatus Neomarinimicrobiota bacterium]MBT3634698.1 polyphosphate polymerase domain-containing protein [Candidatus Neomarinimicrobiota bacterium]MBT3683461.1 polyphosphate polymerase domain-containing protein [Candidatus Neomarinimicrobiota bacterium]MBT3760350.1 polyphosphate polymerase domain-containing protein [Candidatus Neomarinimicrobiota bacterium]MBT3896572.1 polyphosphate polymerase domain-containing protein [Candidatus Neomarini
MRQEYKYLVSDDKIPFLREAIRPHVIPDDHVDIGHAEDYTVRSIYYDDSHMTQYHKKLSGDRNRKKYRIRGYNEYDENNIVFLEIKRKHDLSILKNRAPVYFKNIYDLLITGNIAEFMRARPDFPDAENNALRFLYNYYKLHLVPVVKVIYDREAYLFKFDHSGRVTFDKNLRGSIYPQLKNLYQDQKIKYAFRDQFILEIKSNYGFPEWAVPIIAELGVKRQALSKFTICIDMNKSAIRRFSTNETIAHSKHEYFFIND